MNIIKGKKDHDFGNLIFLIIYFTISLIIILITNIQYLSLLIIIFLFYILKLILKPKTLNEKLSLFVVCFLTVIILYMTYLIFKNELSLKDYASVVSLLLTLWIFNLNNMNNMLKKTEKQLQNLEILSIELDNISETVNWIKNIIETKISEKVAMLIPAHNVKDFNIDYYLTNLDSKIKNIDTMPLKKLLLNINDKVRMINKPVEIYLNKVIETGTINNNAVKYSKINLTNAIDDIEKKIPKAKNIIEDINLS